MSSVFGNNLKVSVFGQSHGPAIGVCIDGLPAGFPVCFERLSAFLQRRRPGQQAYSTQRSEADIPEFISGISASERCVE